ncbi:hypothetical protein BWK49_10710 [Mycobacterium intracellulare subsp. chimaera]|nr:hypothetical protein BWK49_10710 [Mycobacterium intracellulare subsp. chimaera]
MAVAAAASLVVLIGHHCGLQRYERQVLHSSQPSLSSLGSTSVVSADHAAPGRSSSACCHALATASLPPDSTDLVALGVVSAALAVFGMFARLAIPAERGPPSGLATPVTAQDLLTRLCLSRR